MSAAPLFHWQPFALDDVVALLGTTPMRWWVAGCHALEAHLGWSWRSHDDTDLSVVRSDAPLLARALDTWDVQVAAAGVLTPWDGGPLDAARSQNNLWCRRRPDGPWLLDIVLSDGTAQEWVYRRDPTVRRPWPDAVLTTDSGLPYLAPELQLLFKSHGIRPKDDLDAATVVPALEPERALWLADHLAPDHPWQQLLHRATR